MYGEINKQIQSFLSLLLYSLRAHSELGQTSKMKLFAKIVSNLKPLTMIAKSCILDI